MKKIVLLITLLFGLSACSLIKDRIYYRNIADQAISLFDELEYNGKDISSNDKKALDKLITEFSHIDQIVNVSKFIVKTDDYKTNEPNSDIVFKEDDTCYVKYEDLDFDREWGHEMEVHTRVVCDGDFEVRSVGDFLPSYQNVQLDPKYDYIFSTYVATDEYYKFIYRSSYDRSIITVKINLDGSDVSDIELLFDNAVDLDYINKM